MNSSAARRICGATVAVVFLAGVQTVWTEQAASGSAARSSAAASDAVVPYKINVPDAVLSDLKRRLSQARFADEIPDVGWDYGTNLAYLKGLVEYWRDKYDWRAQERKLNQFDQFMTNIDGLNIHFIHQRSRNPNAMPLLLLNGWPSSPIEYMKVIGPLTDPVAFGGRVEDSFDVVVPSMPGFGFSDKPHERGSNTARVAEMWPKLMARLGYNRYFAHGSDLGGQVLNRMGINDAGAHIAALHLTGCGGGAAPAPAGATPPPPPPLTGPNSLVNGAHNAGYQEIQTTKPQTLGQGLSDSPVALASWIIEKWYGWSDHDGDMEKVFTKDELITNIMFYWVPNTGTSSARMYFEVRHAPDGRLLPSFGAGLQVPLPEGYIKVPTGCGAFPSQYDRRGTPISTDVAAARKAAEARYNVMHVAIMPKGGHYPAFEQPKLWLDDIRTFFRDRR